jgi:hypothetical protein
MTTRARPKITLRFQSSDGTKWTKRFVTLAGASAAAIKQIGATPTFGSDYAVSDDGICVVRVSGATLAELFPTEAKEPAPRPEDAAAAPEAETPVGDLPTTVKRGVRPWTKAARVLEVLQSTLGSFDAVSEAIVAAGLFSSASEARDWARYVLKQAGTATGEPDTYRLPGRDAPITITKKSGGGGRR